MDNRHPSWRNLLCVALCLLLAGSAFGADEESPKEEHSSRALAVLVPDLPPLGYADEDGPAGFAAELGEALLASMGRDDPVRLVAAGAGFRRVARSDAAVLIGCPLPGAPLPSALRRVGPVATARLLLVGLKREEDGESRPRASGEPFRIGIDGWGDADRVLRRRGWTGLVLADRPDRHALGLSRGWIDRWAVLDLVMPHVAARNDLDVAAVTVTDAVCECPLYIVFSPAVPETDVARWRRALERLRETGAFDELRRKWLPDRPARSAHVDAGRLEPVHEEQAAAQSADETPPLVLITEENPPANFTKDGKPTGFAVEVVREIMHRRGHDHPVRVLPWSEGYARALKGPRVGLFSTTRTKQREPLFRWVGPLFTAKQVFYARKGSGLKLERLEDAKAVGGIGTYRDDVREQFLKKEGFANLVSAEDPRESARRLQAGEIDLWATTNIAMFRIARAAGVDPGELELAYTFKEADLYIAFSPDTPEAVVAGWQATLDAMVQDGAFRAIHAKWMPPGSFPAEKAGVLRETAAP